MTYTHLTMDERYQIELGKRQNKSLTEIANELGRNPSTLSRELRRNKGERVWRAKEAHLNATRRITERNTSNCRKISPKTLARAIEMLEKMQFSPEQIEGRLKYEGKDGISRESIYKHILEDKKAGGELYKHLRSQKQRRSRYGSKRQRRPNVLNRKSIEERPKVVDKRQRFGDWEGDSIVGAGCNSGIIVSTIERKSRYVELKKLPGKDPGAVANTFIEKLGKFKELVLTCTLDNGGEFTKHEVIARELKANIYFARPYHSYERGAIENVNGLIRQYFRKGQRFDNITNEDVQKVAYKLNHRPRKCLGYKTPYEVFSKECLKKGVALRI